ncbi:hypothetical protein C5167_027987 [Papaver somniferum]|uniref:uncharacterized protein LOC113340922 n=1 Tax=Papaver somniferum TaxID=3469 RepID=UPI000E6FA63C|nr:uncharacterized protein LOC113340922 [Papaver somniferum]RZC92096.1 hypothetical protein C5167_027987 [Papaver somniferum]
MGIWQAGIARLLLLQLLIASAFAADLENPDSEKPPTNIPKNSTNQFIPLNSTINSLPGWSYQGTVQYIISSGQEGNSIYLGQNGKISQTFKAVEEHDQNYDYLLTINLFRIDQLLSHSTRNLGIQVVGRLMHAIWVFMEIKS